MPHDCAARLFSECLCPHTSSVTKAKVLPSPDIAMWKVKFVKGNCQSPLICVSVVMFNLLKDMNKVKGKQLGVFLF